MAKMTTILVKSSKLSLILGAFALMFVFTLNLISAATLNVDNSNPLACDGATIFCTIQSAITYASSGDTINIASGEYIETGQIVINKDLTINGAGRNLTVVKPAQDTGNTNDDKGWFLVTGSSIFNLQRITLNGDSPTHKIYHALRYTGTSSGTVDDVKFVNIKYEESGAAYQGVGVRLITSGNIDVTNSEFSEMGRYGVQIFYGASPTGTFSGNTYTGKGVGNWLDYAFEIGGGAHVVISNNQISNNLGVSSSDGSTSSGVSVWDDPGTQVDLTGNTFTNNSAGLAVATLSGGAEPTVTIGAGNTFTGGEEGVDLQNAGSTGNPSITFGASIFKGQSVAALRIADGISVGQTYDINNVVFKYSNDSLVSNSDVDETMIYDLTDSSNRGQFILDHVSPVVESNVDMTGLEATSSSGRVVTYSSPSASDNVDSSVEVSCSYVSGSTFTLGNSTVTCSATDSHGNTGSSTFVINVVDTTSPTITLNGVSELNVAQGSLYSDSGATANDLVDGSVSVSSSGSVNTAVVGNYTLTYSSTDSHGNNAQETRLVHVTDQTNPVISLVGSSIVTIESGTSYSDSGATASDNNDGNLTSSIEVHNLVNSGVVGNYTVTYDVRDSSGNAAVQVVRTVHVYDTKSPLFTNIISSKTVYNNESLSYSVLTASDSGSGIVSSTVFNNSNFALSNAGVLTNLTVLSTGSYQLTLVVSDAVGNTNSTNIFLTVITSSQEHATNATETVSENTTEIVVDSGSSALEEVIVPESNTGVVNLSLTALQNSSGEVTLSNDFTLTRESSAASYTAQIPANTVIDGGEGWNGKLQLPTVKSNDDFSISGGTPSAVVEMGSTVELNFSNSVKITIGGMAGKRAAWTRGNSVLNEITTKCDSLTNPTNINSTSPRECYIDSGNDLIIWTYHFTTFAAVSNLEGSSPVRVVSGGSFGGIFSRINSALKEWAALHPNEAILPAALVPEPKDVSPTLNDSNSPNMPNSNTITGAATGAFGLSKNLTFGLIALVIVLLVGFLIVRSRRKNEEVKTTIVTPYRAAKK